MKEQRVVMNKKELKTTENEGAVRMVPARCRVIKHLKTRTGCLKVECDVHEYLKQGYSVCGYHTGLFHQYVILTK